MKGISNILMAGQGSMSGPKPTPNMNPTSLTSKKTLVLAGAIAPSSVADSHLPLLERIAQKRRERENAANTLKRVEDF